MLLRQSAVLTWRMLLRCQSLGATGVAFVVESKGALQGTLLAAALAGETIAVTQVGLSPYACDTRSPVLK